MDTSTLAKFEDAVCHLWITLTQSLLLALANSVQKEALGMFMAKGKPNKVLEVDGQSNER